MTAHVSEVLAFMVEARRKLMPRPEGVLYDGTEDFVLNQGRAYDLSAPLTKDELDIVRVAASGIRIVPKGCFCNAQMLAVNDVTESLRYVEGFAIGAVPGFNVLHGWVTINDKVVDLTWTLQEPQAGRRWRRKNTIGIIPEGRSYFGLEFDTMTVLERLQRTHEGSSFIDDWPGRWPLLQWPRKVDPGEVPTMSPPP